jgi:multiple sugar transport system substrate-binding protein
MGKLQYRNLLAVVTTGAVLLAGAFFAAPVQAAKVTITYWTHVNGPTNDFEKKLITEFESKNPNIKVNYLPVEWGQLPTKLKTSIAAGGGPDLFNFFGSYASELISKKYVSPVDFKAFGLKKGKADLLKNFLPAVVNGFSAGDTVYGIPHEVSNHVFWINTDQFKAAGLDPNKDYPKTYEDVIAVGKKLQAISSGGPQEAITLPQYNAIREALTLQMMARQAGGSLFSKDGKMAQLDSAPVIKALQAWGDLVNVHKLNKPSLGPSASNYPEDLFGAGTAAMSNTGGPWVVKVLKDNNPKTNYKVIQQPTFSDGKQVGGTLYGFGLFVPRTSKHKAEAWKFASFLLSKGQQYFDETGVWLGDNATFKSSQTTMFPNWADFSKNFASGEFMPPVVEYSQLIEVIQRAIQRVVLENKPAAESLKTAQSEAVPLMK